MILIQKNEYRRRFLKGSIVVSHFFFPPLPFGHHGPVNKLSVPKLSELFCTGPFNWGEAHCAGEKVKQSIVVNPKNKKNCSESVCQEFPFQKFFGVRLEVWSSVQPDT